MQFPFSPDEHTAMARYLSGVRKQLQDVADLVSTRYGKQSSIAEAAIKSLASTTLLEHEFLLLDPSIELNGESQGTTDAYARAS